MIGNKQTNSKQIVEIAIPTYNRPSEILKRCVELAPQLNEIVSVSIYDNNSKIPVETVLGPLANHPHIKINRNNLNIGADANILRCAENANAEWVWILGDDDEVSTDAVSSLLSLLVGIPPDVGAIKLSSPCGAVDFDSHLNISDPHPNNVDFSFSSNFLFISSSVIKTNAFNSLENEYQSISSMASQVVLMLNILNSGYKILQSNKSLLKNTAKAEWNWVDLEINALNAIKYINHKNEMSFIFTKIILSKIKVGPLSFLKILSNERDHLPNTLSRQRFYQSILCRLLLSENRKTDLFLEIFTTLIFLTKFDRLTIASFRKCKNLLKKFKKTN